MISLLGAVLLALQPPPECNHAPRMAQPFAPILSDSGRLYRGTFSPDGRTLHYFRKETPDKEDYRIFVSRLVEGHWTAGERLHLGGEFSDLYPSVSPDGRRLVFASYRPAPGDTASSPNAYLWYADRQGQGWGPPRLIAPAARFGTYHSGPLIDSSWSIRYHRTSGDWRTRWEMQTRWNGSGYEPEREQADDAAAPWRGWRSGERFVWGGQLSPRGDFVVLDISPVDRSGRRGPADVWVSLRQGNGWSEPVPAGGGVNREGYANFLVFHPDGCSVVFVRDFTSFQRVAIDALLAPARTGQTGAKEPEVVQPGLISTKGRHETFPAIDPVDGSLWFSVYTDNFDRQTIMRAPRSEGGWGPGTVVPFSGTSGDRAPRFSPDGRQLYFTSNRPVPGHPAGDMNIWMVERTGSDWGAPRIVPAPASVPDGRDIHAVPTADGALFVPSNRPGGAGRSDIWRVSGSGAAENLGPPINDERGQPDLWVSPDGRWMLLVVTGHPAGRGGDDLFVSEHRDNAWTMPRLLDASAVNTAEYEYGPSVSPDGRYLYFTSHRSGDADLYRIELRALGLPAPGGSSRR